MRRRKIMIVDSNETSLQILRNRLNFAGFDCETAGDAEEALRRIRRKPPRLVLVDIRTLGHYKYAFLDKVRNIKRFKAIPVFIMASGHDIESFKSEMNPNGVNYIAKPFNPDVVVDKIKKATGWK